MDFVLLFLIDSILRNNLFLRNNSQMLDELNVFYVFMLVECLVGM